MQHFWVRSCHPPAQLRPFPRQQNASNTAHKNGSKKKKKTPKHSEIQKKSETGEEEEDEEGLKSLMEDRLQERWFGRREGKKA